MTTTAIDQRVAMAFKVAEPPDVEDDMFIANWQYYQGVLAGDHLEHQLLYSGVVQELAKISGDYEMLDLGCGDSQYIAEVFKQMGHQVSPKTYTGVDISATALSVARSNLGRALTPPSSFDLKEQDILTFLQSVPSSSFNVVFSSFVIHHLTISDKKTVVEEVARVLKPGGIFLLVDVSRANGQTREEYMREYIPHVLNDWVQLPVVGRERMAEHVSNYDFPECENWYLEVGPQFFSGGVELLRRARYGCCFIMRK